jgi:hypothetical protein
MQLVLAWNEAQFFFLFAGYLLFPIAFVSVQIAPFGLLESLPMVIYVLIILGVRLGVMATHPDKDRSLSKRWGVSRSARFYIEERSTFLYIVAIVLILVGLGCYFIDSGSGGGDNQPTVFDAVSHIIWHALIGIAEYCLIVATSDIVEAKERHANRRKVIY